MLWSSFSKTPFELRPASDVLPNDSILEVLHFETYFDLREVPVPTDTTDVIRQLAAAGFIELADITGHRVTNLGALLLARDLGSFPSLSRKAPRLIRYDGLTKPRSTDGDR